MDRVREEPDAAREQDDDPLADGRCEEGRERPQYGACSLSGRGRDRVRGSVAMAVRVSFHGIRIHANREEERRARVS